MTRPYTSTEIRSARRNTASMSCSTRTMVWRRLSEDSSPIMCCDSSMPMPAIGSSRSSSRGRVASAMATSSWRCSPCARLPARTFILSLRPTSSSTWRAGRVSAESLRASRQKRERDILECREPGIDAGDLERARQAFTRALRRRKRGDVLAREADAAGVGAQVSRELADEGGLAGAVGSDDRVRLALGDMEIDSVARAQRAEALAKTFYFKHRA